MGRSSPYAVVLTPTERRELEARSRRYTSAYFLVVRAKMVLLASDGLTNDEIAHRLDTTRQIVSKWRKRFVLERLAGLEDRPRTGRPRTRPDSPPRLAGGVQERPPR
jgi:Winged helix-turn helix